MGAERAGETSRSTYLLVQTDVQTDVRARARMEALRSRCPMKMGLKVTTVLGKRRDRQGLAHLVKHLPCQHQDLILTPKIQVW